MTDDLIALVRVLARLMPDRQIARLLNRSGTLMATAKVTHGTFYSLMSERLGFILRLSYLIESQRSAARRSVLAAE